MATPIGNLADITLRALEVLRAADAIAAEDTRVTARLLNHYAIAAPLIALHEHNERRAAQRVVALLAAGKSVALVSDAGTPAISDPGALTVTLARAAGYRVVPVPGANAAVTALSGAGVAGPQFLFYGFLPAQGGARRRALRSLRPLSFPLVFYEAPHRVCDTLAALAETLGGGRRVTVARELTKLFEEIHTCCLDAARDWLDAGPKRGRGEFVLIVEGAAVAETAGAAPRRVLELLLRELPLKQAVKLAAAITGGKRNELYKLALELKGGKR